MSESQLCEFLAKYVRSAAYHEAGHVTVAAAQGMPLQEKGIYVDGKGSGVSYYWHRCPGDPGRSCRDQLQRKRTIIALYAGWTSQTKVFPDCPEDAWASDKTTIHKLLEEMYPTDSAARRKTEDKLQRKAEEFVCENWTAIKSLASALLAKAPQTVAGTGPAGRTGGDKVGGSMSGSEVKKLLEQFGICVTVR